MFTRELDIKQTRLVMSTVASGHTSSDLAAAKLPPPQETLLSHSVDLGLKVSRKRRKAETLLQQMITNIPQQQANSTTVTGHQSYSTIASTWSGIFHTVLRQLTAFQLT